MAKKELKALPTRAMAHLAEFTRSDWFVLVPTGVTVEQLTVPSFWAHQVSKLRKHDRVEAVAEDGSFDVELRVIDKDVGFAKMRILREWRNPEMAVPSNKEQYSDKPHHFPCVDYKAASGWRVIGFDGNVVKENLASEADALLALQSYNERSRAA
jgi:hypothetical protein